MCPKGSISDRSVRALREAGIVVVQADDPEKCKYIRAGGEEVGARDLLWGALKAMQLTLPYGQGEGAAKVREEFTKVLFGIVDSRRELAKSVDAVDPHLESEGTPSTRVKEI